jgi:predicted nuclease of predicted toxin-antitoxin system
VKFLVDMPLPPALAHGLAAQGQDAAHAPAVGLDRSTDSEILTRARPEMRTVATADLDYPRLLALTRSGRTKPDLVSWRQLWLALV